jgi:hypothetical protein
MRTHVLRSIKASLPFFLAIPLALACGETPTDGGAEQSTSSSRPESLFRGPTDGVIEPDEEVTWPAGGEVALDEDLVVEGSLIVEQGVVVTAANGVSIAVADGGSLVVEGEPRSPALFTAAGRNRWEGIAVLAGGFADIDWAILEHVAGTALHGRGAAVSVDDTIVRDVIGNDDTGDATGLWFAGGRVSVTDTNVSGVFAADGGAGEDGAEGDAGEGGLHGTPGETPDVGDPIPPMLPTAGGPGQAGANGEDGEMGGEATGVYIGPDSSGRLAGLHIEEIVAGSGGDGGQGGAGGVGGDGGVGAPAQIGADGGDAGAGGSGGLGGPGGDARGIWLDDATLVSWQDNRVDGVDAGSGGGGGDAGIGATGGMGGDGGEDIVDEDAPAKPGAGGVGGMGGDGGEGAAGGDGGIARAVHVNESATDGLLQNELADARAGAGGAAGEGRMGGAGGNGGIGGDASTPGAEAGADGGNGGVGGAGGDAHDGGAAGLAVAVQVSGLKSAEELLSLSTILALTTADPGEGGAAGAGGAGGTAGEPGTGPAEVEPVDDPTTMAKDGLPGEDGLDGMLGAAGIAAGVWATSEASVSAQSNVFQLASPSDGVALVADETSSIRSNTNLFWQVRAISEGDVASGTRDRNEDPRLIDAEGGDARLIADSPAIDAGDNGFLPAEVQLDIDGEVRPVDDPGTDDTGIGDDRPVVDIGAHEFQPPSCEITPSELWPPNHKYVTVSVDLDPGTMSIDDARFRAYASSDEPDNDKGDGNTTGDVSGEDGYTSPVDISDSCRLGDDGHGQCSVDLRAERAGPGDGRTYTVWVEISTEAGTREVECDVHVPHDQSDDEEEVEPPYCAPSVEQDCVEHHHGD